MAGNVLASYGSLNTFKGNASIAGSTNMLDYAAGFTRQKTDGISEAKDLNSTGNFDKDGLTQNSFHASLGIKPSESFSFKPYVRFTDFDGKYDGGSFTDDTQNTYQSKLLTTGLSSSYQMKNSSVQLLYGYTNSDRVFDGIYGKYEYEGIFHHGESYLKHDFTSHIQLLTGVSFQNWKMMDENSTEKNPDINLASPYASLFIRDVQGFSFEAGGRFNSHSKYGTNGTFSFNPSYLYSNQVKLFANISTGFKAPTLYQLFGEFGANENLKPEKSESLEVGAQFFVWKQRADIRIVGFQRTIQDVILYTYPNGYINQDIQNDKGLEVEANVVVTTAIQARLFYSYVDGYVTSGNATNDSKNYNLFRRPKNSVGVNLTYQVTPEFLVSANVKTFGKRDDLYFNNETFMQERVALDSYQLLDFYTEYALIKKKLTVFADAKNLLNQNYYEVYGYATLPFTINVGVNYRF